MTGNLHLEMVYSPYFSAMPLANGVKSFGMWFPENYYSGNGLIMPTRYHGQKAHRKTHQ